MGYTGKVIREYIAYLRDNPEKKWFKSKLFGWGWTPARWQGWVVLILYIALLVMFVIDIYERQLPVGEMNKTMLAAFALLTGTLIAICWITGERPHWQWGIPEKYKQK